MEVSGLVKNYLAGAKVMQLATDKNGQPWICNVHFVADESYNLFWISKTSRRHSHEIAQNSKAAAAIAVKSPDHPVIGIQIEGDAKVMVEPGVLKTAIGLFDSAHGLSQGFQEALLSGKASEKMYRLKPRLIVLFDEQNFPDDPRQEWKPPNHLLSGLK